MVFENLYVNARIRAYKIYCAVKMANAPWITVATITGIAGIRYERNLLLGFSRMKSTADEAMANGKSNSPKKQYPKPNKGVAKDNASIAFG